MINIKIELLVSDNNVWNHLTVKIEQSVWDNNS